MSEVERGGPDDARALTGAGAVLLGLGRPEEAVALLEQAIEIEPGARSYHLLGNALFQAFEARDGGVPARGAPSPPLVMRARRAYQQALQQDPRLVDAYRQLGKTYVYDSESPQPGIELVEKVLARVPSVGLALTLIELHSRNGDRDAAHAVRDQRLVRLVDALSYQPVDPVDRALIRAELLAADAWAGAGRAQDALALARELQDQVEDAELRRQIAEKIRAYQGEENQSQTP